MADQRPTILWADLPMDRKYGTEHFLVVGASGSGKTTIINNLLATVFVRPAKAIVYDPKQEIVPLLYSIFKETDETINSGGQTVRILHPLDIRCSAWDMAKDIDGPVSARQLASILVQDTSTGRPTESFFTDATRDLHWRVAGFRRMRAQCWEMEISRRAPSDDVRALSALHSRLPIHAGR